MALAPVTNINTILGTLQLDLNRTLKWGKNITMKFLVPDQNEVTGLRSVLILTKGFNRVSAKEAVIEDGQTIVYKVSDKSGTLLPILLLKGLVIQAGGVQSELKEVPSLPPNVAQIYTLTCRVRTLRTNFETR